MTAFVRLPVAWLDTSIGDSTAAGSSTLGSFFPNGIEHLNKIAYDSLHYQLSVLVR